MSIGNSLLIYRGVVALSATEQYMFGKFLEGMVPNCGIDVTVRDRRGREIIVPKTKGAQSIQTLRERSFQVNGARIFNSLPRSIKNLRRISVDEFKSKLQAG